LGAGPWYSAPVFNIWTNNLFHHNYYWSYQTGTTVMRFWEGEPYPGTTGILNRSRTVETTNPAKFVTEWQSKASATEKMQFPGLMSPTWDTPYSYGNYSPQATSPLVGAGVPVPGYTHDFAGVPVPEGANATIGAYQGTFTSTGQRSAPGKNLRYYPNPFRSKTEIRVYLDRTEHVNLFIHDLSGRIIRTLVRNTLPAGTSSVVWNGANDAGDLCPGGMYLCCLIAGNEVNTGKLMLLR
jgi:hypothetical protein